MAVVFCWETHHHLPLDYFPLSRLQGQSPRPSSSSYAKKKLGGAGTSLAISILLSSLDRSMFFFFSHAGNFFFWDKVSGGGGTWYVVVVVAIIIIIIIVMMVVMCATSLGVLGRFRGGQEGRKGPGGRGRGGGSSAWRILHSSVPGAGESAAAGRGWKKLPFLTHSLSPLQSSSQTTPVSSLI